MSTVTATITRTAAAAASSSAVSNSTVGRVTSQAGIIDGLNPTKYNAADPIVLFIIQAVIIIAFCRLLHLPLSMMRQPRVIAEVIGGILLGPTVCGRIPGFTAAIFPVAGMAVLRMAANFGLLMFLFLVGLEVDLRLIGRNWKIAASVGAGGMVLPFGLGAALSVGLYNTFSDDKGTLDVKFGTFLLFVGVALSITAFPVLCRILTELKLLQNNIGVIVLSAGVGNDVIGWVLLALTVALVNAGSGIEALYVLLIAVGWILFLVFAIRPVFIYVLRRSGSLDDRGPTQGMVCLTIVLVLASSFFTDIIGVHPIFGAFLVGLICPHEGGFAVKLTEKVEDLVSVIFLPLYFALSGLSTNIGLLDTGEVWAYVFAICGCAFFGKIGGGTIAARLNGLLWRESFTVGVLMSCKGLVELIVLNIGLQAGILSARLFTMFVLMALVTTFATTPLTIWLYPVPYRRKVELWRRGEIDWEGNRLLPEGSFDGEKTRASSISRLTVLLRLDSLPSILAFINLLKSDASTGPSSVHRSKEAARFKDAVPPKREAKLEVHGLRLVEVGERNSSVMRVAEEAEFSERDPVVNVFRTFGRLNNFACAAGLSLIPADGFADALAEKARDTLSDLLVIPWSENGSMQDNFDHAGGVSQRFSGGSHTNFIAELLEKSRTNTAIFINHGFGGTLPQRKIYKAPSFGGQSALSRVATGLDVPTLPVLDPSHHVFFPFIGGADDCAALRFVLQLVKNTNVTATIVHVINSSKAVVTDDSKATTTSHITEGSSSNAPSITPVAGTDVRGSIGSGVEEQDHAFYMQLAESLPVECADRVVFETVETNQPLAHIIKCAKEEVSQKPNNAGDLIVVGRGHVAATSSLTGEVAEFLLSVGASASSDTRKSLGDVADSVLQSKLNASLLVFKAASSS